MRACVSLLGDYWREKLAVTKTQVHIIGVGYGEKDELVLSPSVRARVLVCVFQRERAGGGDDGVKTACGSLANIPLTLLSPVPGFVYVGHAAGCVTRTRTSVRARRNPNQAHTTPPLFHFKES